MRSKFKWIFTLLLAFSMQFSFAQEKTVTGVVTENGMPIPGVTVAIKGTTVGSTQTDFDGKYSIKAKSGQVLEFSYIGLKTQAITVGTSNAISVKMSIDDAIDLGEVIVVAYGTQTKESLTGSVAEIKAEEVSKITTGNVTQGLVGKVAGVQVAAGTGMPGDGATIRIRGIGSLSVGTPPLYVVDGVPFYGQINSINTQDIASMTILKDASAAALYGSRGASGVIIITTKKGKNRKSVITLDSRAGYASRAVGEYDLITSQSKYYEAYFQGLKNTYMFNGGGMSATDAANLANANLITGGQGLQYNAYDVANDQIIDPVTGKFKGGNLKYDEDFSDYLFGDGFFTQTSVSVAGGDENTTHYFSLGYEKNDGYVVNSGFEKITSRLKVDSKISDRFKLGANISYAHTEQNYLDGYTGGSSYSSPFFWVRNIAPIYPVYSYDVDGNANLNALGQHLYDDGTGADGMSPIRPFGSLQHPYATAINDYKKRIRDNVFASGYLDAKIVDNLVFTYTLTGELSNLLDLSMDTQLYGDAVGAGGRVLNTSTRQLSFTHQQLLKYNKSFGNHNFDVLAGHESLARNYDYVQAERSKLLFDSPNVDHGSVYQSNAGGGEDYFLEGYLARIAYDYNNKYYVNLSGRRDGSSRFAPDQRWGTFFGAGASWRVSQEAFLNKVSWLDELKIKGSFGQQGNDEIGYNLPWLTPYTIQPTNDTSLPIAYGAGDYLGNKDIKWETSTNMNFGFDASLFKNRLNFEVEYFVKNISDMLFNRPIPVSLTGFTVRPENIGDMNNKGFEITMDGDIYRNNDWTVSLNLNATTYKNTITRLPSNGKENNQIISGNYIREENGGAYDFYMREYAGVNPANGAALFWMNVDDNDATLGRQLTENNSEADLYRIGKTALPDVFGGFGTNIKYKGIDVGIDFAYQYGGYASDSVWLNAMSLSPGGGLHSDYAKTWSVDNPTGTLPRVDTDDPNNFYGGSTLSLIKSDYLSIQNISAGYTFDTKVVEKLGLNKLRFYALADNVHLWSKRQGFDPRQSGITGDSGNTYSILRTISFGVNLEF